MEGKPSLHLASLSLSLAKNAGVLMLGENCCHENDG